MHGPVNVRHKDFTYVHFYLTHMYMHLLRHEINSNELIIPHSHSQANSCTIHRRTVFLHTRNNADYLVELLIGLICWIRGKERERKKLNHLYESSNTLFKEMFCETVIIHTKFPQSKQFHWKIYKTKSESHNVA